jgi:regulator of protease activity HflC (stomatin/prohibitin superfamily)
MLFIICVLIVVGAIALYVGGRDAPERGRAALLALAAAFGLLALAQCLTVVPAGNVGVIDFFGNVSARVLHAGINFVNPLARIVKMSIKTQELKEVMDVPSREGLTVGLEASVLFHSIRRRRRRYTRPWAGNTQRDPRAAVPLGAPGRHGWSTTRRRSTPPSGSTFPN